MRSLRQIISKLTDPIYQQQGFIRSTIIMDWKLIVGSRFSQYCQPEKITFPFERKTGGRLVLRTTSSFATGLQYEEPVIIEKINQYFGYGAVEKIIIRHGPIDKGGANGLPRKKLDEKTAQEITQAVGSIENTNLRDALYNLGVGILTQEDKVKKSESTQSNKPKIQTHHWDGSLIR